MTEKRYDRAYFDHWYRGRNRVSTKDDVRRKVSLAVAECEYFLHRRLRSVLDVGCGEGAWHAHITALRPAAKYLGLDPSDYAVKRFGAKRNIRKAAFAELPSARLRGPFDLVVCSDALHYIQDDDIIGDLHGMIRRPAAWYRNLFRKAGLTQAGPYTWLAPDLVEDAAELEVVR